MDNTIYLLHDQSGMGVDFQVLDVILTEDRIFVVLMPATAGDSLICSNMMEHLEESLPAAEPAADVCILEMKEEKDGKCSYIRVEKEWLEKIFSLFRKRNGERFRFL